ncbi:unnamed protein product [Rhizopus stolonifer]
MKWSKEKILLFEALFKFDRIAVLSTNYPSLAEKLTSSIRGIDLSNFSFFLSHELLHTNYCVFLNLFIQNSRCGTSLSNPRIFLSSRHKQKDNATRISLNEHTIAINQTLYNNYLYTKNDIEVTSKINFTNLIKQTFCITQKKKEKKKKN